MTNEERILALLEAQRDEIRKVNMTLEAQGDEIRKINMTLENQVGPQLQALAEGQQTLLQTLAPRSRVEQLEEEMDLLKTALRALSRDVAELKGERYA